MTGAGGQFTFEERGSIIYTDLTSWSGDVSELGEQEDEWLEIAEQNHITGSVIELGSVSLNSETQAYIGEAWTQLTDAAGVDRGAFVSEGLGAMAANANVDATANMRSFSDVDDAETWAAD